MKSEYIRSMQSSFLQLELDVGLNRTEEEMLSNNQIDGILSIGWQREDGKYLLRYDITGKQALDVLLENQTADETLIFKLLSGICLVLKQLDKYLLSQNGLLLNPEMIFWDYKTEIIYFCYYPKEENQLQEQFLHFMEYLLTKTDHKNLTAVELAYGVYEELMKPSYSLSQIQERIQREREKQKSMPEEPEEDLIIEEAEEEREEVQKTFWLKKIWEECWSKFCATFLRNAKKEIEPFVFEPEEEPIKQGEPTILLSERKEKIRGILKYEGTLGLPDLEITNVPFLIGSADECDGIIKEPTISRKHAIITMLDEIYFIEDLNSANGTIVDGGMINYKTKISLKKNESICFANQPYRFL